jgi:ribosome maturation factor RimP
MYQDIPDDLKEMIEPVVEDHGLELVDVETIRGGGPALLRITIDSKAGDGRVPVDDLASVSREIETQLDTGDAILSAYRLEVSSPGLDRMLTREKDFPAALGSQTKIKTRRPLDGRRRFKGELIGFEDGVVEVRVDGESVRIPFSDIEKANVVYSFSSTDFQGASSD